MSDWSSPDDPADVPPPAYGAPPPPPGYPPQYGYGAPQYGAPQYGYGAPQYGAQYGAWGAPAPKPGVIPLRPLALGEILDGAFTTIRRHPAATLGVSAVVAGAQALLNLLASVFIYHGIRGGEIVSGTALTAGGLLYLITFVVGAIASSVLTGILCVVVSDAILGRPVSAATAWSRVRPRVWRLVGLSLLVALGTIVGMFVCGVGAIFVLTAWYVAAPALVLERTNATAALGRSWRLVKPSFWRVLGIGFLALLIATIVSGLLVAPFSLGSLSFSGSGLSIPSNAADAGPSTIALVLRAIASAVAATLVLPFKAGVHTLVYADQRMRLEGLDITLRNQALGGPGQL